ncbi:hypothetical protein ACPPVO_12350 [Dactylosporangium sp. McL0621]|uniref:hypothetical protein n=1 Tax=Dactylosporangium sp. McL0621 TaxID=3415678 RepID=UPI003CF4C37A
MTDRGETVPDSRGETPVDLATLHADDALLDALARGERPGAPSGDALTDLFADWHADLSADLPDLDLDSLAGLDLDSPGLDLDSPGLDLDSPGLDLDSPGLDLDSPGLDLDSPGLGPDLPELRDAAPEAETVALQPVVTDISEMRRRRRPGAGLRRTFAAVAAALVILAGLAVGAERSGPNGPLWPLTQVLYPEQAHARAAEQAIAEAADAIAAGRYDDARRLLDTAANEAAQVDNPGTRQRLLDRIADLRSQLPPPAPAAATPSATSAPPPTTEAAPDTPTPAPGATTAGGNPGGGGGATNTPGNGGDGQIIPGLPTQIVPTGPVLPLPTQILPSVPGLPLPTLLG